MSPDRTFRSLAAALSAAAGVLVYGIIMTIVGLITGAWPLPVSYLLAASAGASVGYWKSGRILERPQDPAPREEPHL